MPGPMNLVTVQTTDWMNLVRWYEEVLRLTVVVREEADGFAMLATGDGGAMLAIASDHPDQAGGRGEGRVAPGFLVADLDATLAELGSFGVPIDPVIDGEAEGYRLARIWDPDGNRLHLYTYG